LTERPNPLKLFWNILKSEPVISAESFVKCAMQLEETELTAPASSLTGSGSLGDGVIEAGIWQLPGRTVMLGCTFSS
jgi:hypothetical protein